MRYMKEIIGAKERCTNVVLSSFGICTQEPLMTLGSLKKELIKSNKNIYFYVFIQEDRMVNDSSLIATGNKIYSGIGKRIVGIKTLKKFIFYLKENKIFGHYIISLSDHVLALHYLKNNDFYMVDTELKFLSNRKIESFLIVEDDNLDKIFLDFLSNNPQDYRIGKI